MKQRNPTRHWSQLSTEEQIRFWQGVDAGETSSFLVPAVPRKTRRVRGEHSTRAKCGNPRWFRPARYKPVGGQIGYLYNRLVKTDPEPQKAANGYQIICKTFVNTVLRSSDKPGMISVTRDTVDKWKRPSLAAAAGVRAAQNLK